MSQCCDFTTSHAVVRIAKKGSKTILPSRGSYRRCKI